MMVFMAPEVYLNRRVRHCRFARGWFALIFGCLCPGHEDICNILQCWFWTICRINLLHTSSQVSPEHLSATPERPKQAKHLVGTAGGVNDALKLLLEEVGLSDHQTRGWEIEGRVVHLTDWQLKADATMHYEKRVASLDLQRGVWRARPFEGASGLMKWTLWIETFVGFPTWLFSKIVVPQNGWWK